MVNFLFYISISCLCLFGNVSFGNVGWGLDCTKAIDNEKNQLVEELKPYINKDLDTSLHVICNEAKEDTDACCVNSGRCSKSVASKIGNALAEIGPQFLQEYLKIKGAYSGDTFKACQYNNTAQVIGPLGDVLHNVIESSCTDSVSECKVTCEDTYTDFLLTFAIYFVNKGLLTAPSNNSSSDNVIAPSNVINLESLDLNELKDIVNNIREKCKNDFDDQFEKIDELYEKGTKGEKILFSKGKGIKDFVICDKILDTLDPADTKKTVRKLQLQLCQKALQSNGITRYPSQQNVGTSPSTGTTSNFAGNEDEVITPSTTGIGDVGPEIGDDIPDDGEPPISFPSGFGSLGGGSGGGGSGGGGSGGGGSGGGGSGGEGPGDGYYTGYIDENDYSFSPGNPGSGEKYSGNRESSNNYQDGSSPKSRDVASEPQAELDLKPYLLTKREGKSIFQIASFRIQKYCAEKIKQKCL